MPMLPCLRCGETTDLVLSLGDGRTFSCQECSSDFTLDEVRKVLRVWPLVVAWAEAMPSQEQVDETEREGRPAGSNGVPL